MVNLFKKYRADMSFFDVRKSYNFVIYDDKKQAIL